MGSGKRELGAWSRYLCERAVTQVSLRSNRRQGRERDSPVADKKLEGKFSPFMNILQNHSSRALHNVVSSTLVNFTKTTDLPGWEFEDPLSEIGRLVGQGIVPEDEAEGRNIGSRQNSCQLNSFLRIWLNLYAQAGVKCKLTWTTVWRLLQRTETLRIVKMKGAKVKTR